jgi:hypothetical protein
MSRPTRTLVPSVVESVAQGSGLTVSSWQLDTLISQIEVLLELTKRQTTDERRSIAGPIVSAYPIE